MISVAQLKDVPASPSLRPDIAELRSRVAQIAPQIKARAHTTEKAGRVPEENIIALRNIGYFDIVKPAMFGGYEHDFDVLVELNIELAKSCASTAWVGGLLAAHQWLIAGFPVGAAHDDGNEAVAIALGGGGEAEAGGVGETGLEAVHAGDVAEQVVMVDHHDLLGALSAAKRALLGGRVAEDVGVEDARGQVPLAGLLRDRRGDEHFANLLHQ